MERPELVLKEAASIAALLGERKGPFWLFVAISRARAKKSALLTDASQKLFTFNQTARDWSRLPADARINGFPSAVRELTEARADVISSAAICSA